MPHLTLGKDKVHLDVSLGENLMQALLKRGMPVASSCHGDGVCGKCRMEVLAGGENLSPPTERELFLKERFHIPANIRISCQTQVYGDATLTTTYW